MMMTEERGRGKRERSRRRRKLGDPARWRECSKMKWRESEEVECGKSRVSRNNRKWIALRVKKGKEGKGGKLKRKLGRKE